MDRRTLNAILKQLTSGNVGEVDVMAFVDGLIESDAKDAMAAIWTLVNALIAARLEAAEAKAAQVRLPEQPSPTPHPFGGTPVTPWQPTIIPIPPRFRDDITWRWREEGGQPTWTVTTTTVTTTDHS